MNVALGGTLVQHVDDHMQLEQYNLDAHTVTIDADSRLAGIVGTTTLGVNTLHHQVLDTLASGVHAVGPQRGRSRGGDRVRRRAGRPRACSGIPSCCGTGPSTSRCSVSSSPAPDVARVLVPLPDRDFDVTEVAVPWAMLTEAGHEVVVRDRGRRDAGGRSRLLDRRDLRTARGRARAEALLRAARRHPGIPPPPRAGAQVVPADFDALLLPGGHAPGMRQSSAAPTLRGTVLACWTSGRPVAAICHGVLVLARTIDPTTGHSVLHESRTTCLPKYMERSAYYATAWQPRPLLPHVPRVRGGRGARRAYGTLTRSSRAAPARSVPAAPRRTTPPRSSWRTAATCRRAGRATPTRSHAP